MFPFVCAKGALGTAVTRHVLGILGTKRHPLLGVQIAKHGGHIDTTQAVWAEKFRQCWGHVHTYSICIQHNFYNTPISHDFPMICHSADWITARLLQCLIFREMRFDKSSLQLLNRPGAGHELLKETVDIYFLDGSSTVSSIQMYPD